MATFSIPTREPSLLIKKLRIKRPKVWTVIITAIGNVIADKLPCGCYHFVSCVARLGPGDGRLVSYNLGLGIWVSQLTTALAWYSTHYRVLSLYFLSRGGSRGGGGLWRDRRWRNGRLSRKGRSSSMRNRRRWNGGISDNRGVMGR